MDQENGDVTERCIVLAFESPESSNGVIPAELKKKFRLFHSAYENVYHALQTSGTPERLVAESAWVAAKAAVPLTPHEVHLYEKEIAAGSSQVAELLPNSVDT